MGWLRAWQARTTCVPCVPTGLTAVCKRCPSGGADARLEAEHPRPCSQCTRPSRGSSWFIHWRRGCCRGSIPVCSAAGARKLTYSHTDAWGRIPGSEVCHSSGLAPLWTTPWALVSADVHHVSQRGPRGVGRVAAPSLSSFWYQTVTVWRGTERWPSRWCAANPARPVRGGTGLARPRSNESLLPPPRRADLRAVERGLAARGRQ